MHAGRFKMWEREEMGDTRMRVPPIRVAYFFVQPPFSGFQYWPGARRP
jgi:hypothetical protein